MADSRPGQYQPARNYTLENLISKQFSVVDSRIVSRLIEPDFCARARPANRNREKAHITCRLTFGAMSVDQFSLI